MEPPPRRPASDTEWCGARNGRDVSTPRSRRRPATEWSCVASSASSRESSGRIVARRRASIVLPAPGGPTINRLCPPAAATSSALRACACPRISDRSTPAAASVDGAAPGSIAGGSHVPRRKPATSASVAAPTTRSDPICAASSALAAGTTTPCSPARAAAIATDRMPGRREQLSLERELARERISDDGGRGHLARRGEHTDRHRQVEPGTVLAEARRREVDHHASERPFESGALHGRSDAIARVVHRRARAGR